MQEADFGRVWGGGGYRSRQGVRVHGVGGRWPAPGGPGGDAPADAEQPPREVVAPHRAGLAGEGQEHGLGGVLRGVAVAQDRPADAEHEWRVAVDQELERPGVPVGGEPGEQGGVCRPGGVRAEGGEQAGCGSGHERASYPCSSRANGRSYTNFENAGPVAAVSGPPLQALRRNVGFSRESTEFGAIWDD